MLAAQTIEKSVDLVRLVLSSPIKVIKLFGYSTFNKEKDHSKRYKTAKRTFHKR